MAIQSDSRVIGNHQIFEKIQFTASGSQVPGWPGQGDGKQIQVWAISIILYGILDCISFMAR